MKATETQLVKFLQGVKQFVIPIYQRTYSWTNSECEQLWKDILRVAQNEKIPSHFIGSVVYIEKGLFQASSVPQLLVIDGQQRLATVSLLLAAFARVLGERGDRKDITKGKISNYFLFNREESDEKRHKLILTQRDRNTLEDILEERKTQKPSHNLASNFKFFYDKITENVVDLDQLYRGIEKLVIVDVSLDSNHDNPQLIFESLNSTGKELSQTDLIRNYILMDLEKEAQERIYKKYWFPMEERFSRSTEPGYFDRFMRDYLTIKTRNIPNIKNVYSSFKQYADERKVDDLVSDIHRYSEFFIKLAFAEEEDTKLNQVIRDINSLKVDVMYPFLLEMLVNCSDGKLSKDELTEIFRMAESYVFRRTICDIPTNTLNKTFANLESHMDNKSYLESAKAVFNLFEKYRRFPNDAEFRDRLLVKNVYHMKTRKYLFDKLEEFGNRKEKVDTKNCTIEHVMPQNKDLSREWKDDLGQEWRKVHEKYLHTVGNLTLTGYNSELGDRPFLEKRDMNGGFAKSPLWLNSDLKNLDRWNKDTIEKRTNMLAEHAAKIWKFPDMQEGVLAKYRELEDDIDEDLNEDDYLNEDEPRKRQWAELLQSASNEVRQSVEDLIEQIRKKIDCEAEPNGYWFCFYVRQPTEKKSLFALIRCGKNTANIMFRVNPNTFKNVEHIRQVAGWFFPRGTERRISINHERIPQILYCLDHAYSTTEGLLKRREV